MLTVSLSAYIDTSITSLCDQAKHEQHARRKKRAELLHAHSRMPARVLNQVMDWRCRSLMPLTLLPDANRLALSSSEKLTRLGPRILLS